MIEAFVDIETTSLARPFEEQPGEVWEVGLITRKDAGDMRSVPREYRWWLPVNLRHADPESLEISGFHNRHPQGNSSTNPTSEVTLLSDFVHEFVGALNMNREPDEEVFFIGNVSSFDDERIANLFIGRDFGYYHSTKLPWHYHLVCVENLIAGRLGIKPPWNSKDLSEKVYVPVPEDRHDALVDARWAMAMYDAVFNHHLDEQQMLRDHLKHVCHEPRC